MAGNPFHDELDDTFRGTRVRAHTAEHTYEGSVLRKALRLTAAET
jgi:hypothetical protein